MVSASKTSSVGGRSPGLYRLWTAPLNEDAEKVFSFARRTTTGAEAEEFSKAYAALKRRSSTVVVRRLGFSRSL